jgi:hypothetical protein
MAANGRLDDAFHNTTATEAIALDKVADALSALHKRNNSFPAESSVILIDECVGRVIDRRITLWRQLCSAGPARRRREINKHFVGDCPVLTELRASIKLERFAFEVKVPTFDLIKKPPASRSLFPCSEVFFPRD